MKYWYMLFGEIRELIVFCFLGFGLNWKSQIPDPKVNLGSELASVLLGFASYFISNSKEPFSF